MCVARGATSDENKSDLAVNTHATCGTRRWSKVGGGGWRWLTRCADGGGARYFARWNSPGPHFSWFSETIRASEFQIWRLSRATTAMQEAVSTRIALRMTRERISRELVHGGFFFSHPPPIPFSSSRKRLRAVCWRGASPRQNVPDICRDSWYRTHAIEDYFDINSARQVRLYIDRR